MFTGFASENTPAIQVWDFSRPQVGGTTSRISLSDDCAPIQYFKTGSSGTSINLYLPSCPIEGKQIRIINASFSANNQRIEIFSSDVNGQGTNSPIYRIGQGQTLDLCYSKEFISFGPSNGSLASGWISTNQSPVAAANFHSVVLGGLSNSATASRSAVIGGNSNTASAGFSSILCGDSNTASGAYSSVIGGQSNTASSNFSSIVGGYSNTASQTASGVFCGNNNTASGSNSGILCGTFNSASGNSSAILGGDTNVANGENSAVIGAKSGTNRSIAGAVTFAAAVIPVANFVGISQTTTLLLGRQTTDATATRLTSNTSAAATTNQVILPNNSAYTFQGTCVANVTAGGTTSGWKFEGVIKRGANAASTTLVAAVTPTVIAQDAGASTWVLAITADTTNGGIAVTVTGAAATTIRWVVKIETTEVTF
jgi:hypothetical protein